MLKLCQSPTMSVSTGEVHLVTIKGLVKLSDVILPLVKKKKMVCWVLRVRIHKQVFFTFTHRCVLDIRLQTSLNMS